MEIAGTGKTRRQKWTDIGTGMFIMLAIFLLADGIRKIIHHNDLGWFLAPVWSFVLFWHVYRALKY